MSPLKSEVLDEFVAGLAERQPRWAVLRVAGDPGEELAERVEAVLEGVFDGVPGTTPTVLVVDDLAGLARSLRRSVQAAAGRTSRFAAAGVRMVVGMSAPDESMAGVRIEVGYLQERNALQDRILAWAGDRHTPGVLLVTGPPGSGKTVLLREAARRLRRAAGIVVAHESIRDWAAGSAAVRTMSNLVADVSRATGVAPPTGRPVNVGINVNVNYGSVTGAEISVGGDRAAETLIDILLERVARGQSGETVAIVIDAVDEWERQHADWLAQLRMLLSRQAEFARWNVKLLLSAQSRPGWLTGGDHVDLAEEDSDADLRAFATARLTAMGVPSAAAAEDIRRLSGGLFLVAAGYLAEIADGKTTPGELATAKPPGSATKYLKEALERLRADLGGAQSQPWLDVEQLMAILAVLPGGMSPADVAAMWAAHDHGDNSLGSTVNWYPARDRILAGPARRYLVSGDHYDLVHGSLREVMTQAAVGDGGDKAWVAANEQLTPAAERRRWLAVCTPLDSADDGWDPVGGRIAIAEVVPVLTDLIAEARGENPVDENGLRYGREAVRRLLERWDWLETYLSAVDPEAPVRLGIGQLLPQLDRLLATDPELGATGLWAAGVPVPVRAVPPPAAAPKPGKPEANTPRYPSVHTPLIREIVSGRSQFRTREQAAARIALIKRTYAVSRDTQELDEPDVIIIWINGFDLDQVSRSEGRKGHYAKLAPVEIPGGWTVRAERVASGRGAPHPPAVEAANPNWAQWLLRRAVNNPKPYAKSPLTFPDRNRIAIEFDKLKRRFPEAVVNIEHNPLVYVYDRASGFVDATNGDDLPITRAELVIVTVPGGYQVEVRIKGYLSRTKRVVPLDEIAPAPESAA